MRYLHQLVLLACVFMASLIGAEQVVILGGGPAGLTAAIYAARAGLSPLVIEGEEPGGQIALSYSVDNFPGFPEGITGPELVSNMRQQALRFGARFESGNVSAVDLSQRPFTLTFEEGIVTTDALIVATGASAKWLGLPSEQALIGRGVSSCAVCDGLLYKGKEVVVIGGGDTALEDALYLARHASKVTIIHRRETLRASKILQRKAFADPKIHFVWNSEIIDIRDPSKGCVSAVLIRNTQSCVCAEYPCDGVFVAIGHQPNTDGFHGQLTLDELGYIPHQPHSTSTNISGVFVAGDVSDTHYRQAITAAGSGCMAAMDAYEFIQSSKEKRECFN